MSNIEVKSPRPAAFGSDLSITIKNRHTGIEIFTFSPGDDLIQLQESRMIFDNVVRGPNQQNVFNYSIADVFKRDAWIVAAKSGDLVFASGYAHVETTGELFIRGLAVDPQFAGHRIGSALSAAAIVHGDVAGHDVTTAVAAIRLFSDGALNESSRYSLERVGFKLDDGCGKTRLNGSYRDAHLLENAEMDEFGPFTTYRMLRASKDIVTKSKAFLSEWVQMYKHLPKLQEQ